MPAISRRRSTSSSAATRTPRSTNSAAARQVYDLMDYDKALRSVRGAAQELSRFVETVYGES